MPDILRIKTKEWELNVWCNDIAERQKVLSKTLEVRRGLLPKQELFFSESSVRFSTPLQLEFSAPEHSNAISFCPLHPVNELFLSKPVFFENLQYQFEWIFPEHLNVRSAEVQHKLKSVCDAFRFSTRTGKAVLQGVVLTTNDIGWLRLPIEYDTGDKHIRVSLSFEVLPVKIDLEHDLKAMYKTVDEILPLWRFALAQKTEQEVGKGRNRGYFPLLWLARFETLRQQLSDGLRLITYSPHNRLMPEKKQIKADRIKGYVSPKLAELIQQNQKSGLFDKRYSVNRKRLSIDTPENRFIKMVVYTTKLRLECFYKVLSKSNDSPDKQVLSDAFLEVIKSWQTPLTRFQTQSFYKEIGQFSGMNGESLVLQQKTGYSAVYRVWQELKYYLDVLGEQDSLSMKSVAEIYEIWCFLEIRRILCDDLGFKETVCLKNNLTRKQFELFLTDGIAGAYQFSRSDGVELRLAHEPLFSSRNSLKQPIRVWTVSQKPDIFLEVTFPDGKRFVWLFDAKYRIRPISEGGDRFDYELDPVHPDFAPDDAINQMHRYRDALIRSDVNEQSSKSRPVFGAFVLYPGFFNQTDTNCKNPYSEAIREVGIGAFAFLPSATNSENGKAWLKSFLIGKLGLNDIQESTKNAAERFYLNEAIRIPYLGMKQTLYSDLTLIVQLFKSNGESAEYFNRFFNGNARWYHIPEKEFVAEYATHIAKEICYIGVVITTLGGSTGTLKRIWRVRSATLLQRRFITEEQSGSTSSSTDNYWLFELCEPFSLYGEISGVPVFNSKQVVKLTTYSNIQDVKSFDSILDVYEDVLVK